jgi:hypothetical protein
MCIRALDYCPRSISTSATTCGDHHRGHGPGPKTNGVSHRLHRELPTARHLPARHPVLSQDSLCWRTIREDEQQGIFKTIASRLRFFVHQLTYLDEFPNLDEVRDIDDASYRMSLKKGLIENREERWDTLAPNLKARLWTEVIGEKPLPYENWEALEPEKRTDAEKVLWKFLSDREKIYSLTSAAQSALHLWLAEYKDEGKPAEMKAFEQLTGLYFRQTPENQDRVAGLEAHYGKFTFEVHSFRGAQRVGPTGNTVNEVVISLTQKRKSRTLNSAAVH